MLFLTQITSKTFQTSPRFLNEYSRHMTTVMGFWNLQIHRMLGIWKWKFQFAILLTLFFTYSKLLDFHPTLVLTKILLWISEIWHIYFCDILKFSVTITFVSPMAAKGWHGAEWERYYMPCKSEMVACRMKSTEILDTKQQHTWGFLWSCSFYSQ